MKKKFDAAALYGSYETCDDEIRIRLANMKPEDTLWRYREYLEQVLKEPVLSPKEEQDLIREGGEAATEKLVSSMLRYSVTAALRCEGCGIPTEDLIAEGNMILAEAVKRCVETERNPCSGYVIWMLKKQLYSMVKQHLPRPKFNILRDDREWVQRRIRSLVQEQKQAAEEVARGIRSVRAGEVVFLNLQEGSEKMDYSHMGRVWEQSVQLLPAIYLQYESEPFEGGTALRSFYEEVFIVPDAENLDATEQGQRWLLETIEAVRADKGFVFAGVEISTVLSYLREQLNGLVRDIYL